MTIARPATAVRPQPQAMPYPAVGEYTVTGEHETLPHAAANADNVPRTVVVQRQWAASDGVKAIELAAADGHALPPASAGAHIDVHLPDGTIRQYSVTNAGDTGAAPTHYRIAVLREAESRGGSRYLVDELSAGEQLTITGPRNHFALDEAGQTFRLIAGGIGVTPLLAMARRLVELGRTVAFHYLVRSRERAAFVDELRALLPEHALHLHVSAETGRPDAAMLVGTATPDSRVYSCGPSSLIDAVDAATAAWPAGQVQFERFANTNLQGPAESTANETCQVTLQQSGTRFELQAGETLLEALQRKGADVPYCCREGVCGTCAVDIIEGDVEHRDALQDDDEKQMNDVMFVCVSQPIGSHLVLDL